MPVVIRAIEDVTKDAVRVLAREIGVADTMRFLSQFRNGSGNYTEERHALLGNPSVEEFFAEVHRREALRSATQER